MQFFVVGVVVLASLVYADNVEQQEPVISPIHGYIKNIGIPAAERLRKAEENYLKSRIVGGVPAGLGQYPFQAGLLGDVVGLPGMTLCGGSLVSPQRVVSAAHCWFDGINQAWRFTVVLGSVFLFSGGVRIQTSAVASHPNYSHLLARNDIAMLFLPTPVVISDTIAPISLPTASELFENFAGNSAIAVGFGLTADGGSISTNQMLNHVRLNVITNTVCTAAFPVALQASNICTSGVGGIGICRGDSGGPLIVTRNNRPILIGVSSFVSSLGCQSGLPAVYARVTAFMDFINNNL